MLSLPRNLNYKFKYNQTFKSNYQRVECMKRREEKATSQNPDNGMFNRRNDPTSSTDK